jgi:hypothetical protein
MDDEDTVLPKSPKGVSCAVFLIGQNTFGIKNLSNKTLFEQKTFRTKNFSNKKLFEQKLFEPTFRAAMNSASTDGRGEKAVVEMHQGCICAVQLECSCT